MSSLKEIADLLKEQNAQDMIQSEKLGHIDADIHSFLEFTKRAREDDKKDAIEEKRERRRLSQLASAAAAAAAAKTATTTKDDQKDDSPNLLGTILKGILGIGVAGAAATALKSAVTPTRKFGRFDPDGKVKGPGQAARGMTGSQAKLAKINADIEKAKIKLELERIRAQQAMLDDIQKQVERERARVAQQKNVRAIADRNKLLRDMTAFDEVEQTATKKAAERLPKGPTVFTEAPEQPTNKYKVGDTVKYTQRNGTVVDKIIKRIDPSGRIILSHANGSGAFAVDPEKLRGGGKPPVTRTAAPTVPKTPTSTTRTAPTRPAGTSAPSRTQTTALGTPAAASKPPTVGLRNFGAGGARPAPGGPGKMPTSIRGAINALSERRRNSLLNEAYKNPKFGKLLMLFKVAGATAMAVELIYVYLLATDQGLEWFNDGLVKVVPKRRSQEEKASELTNALIVLINGTIGASAAAAAVGTLLGSAAGPWTGIIAGLGGAVVAMKYGPRFPAQIIAMLMAGYTIDQTFNAVVGSDDPNTVAGKLGIRLKTSSQLTVAESNLTSADIAFRQGEYAVMSQYIPNNASGIAADYAAKVMATERSANAARGQYVASLGAAAAATSGGSARSGSSFGRRAQRTAAASNYATSGAMAKALNDDLFNTVMQNNPSLGVSIVDPASMDALANAIVDALAAMPAGGGGGGGSRGLQLISAPPPIDLDAIGPQ